MRNQVIALASCLLVLGLASGAWAQSRPSTAPSRPSAETAAPRTTDDAQRPAWSPDYRAVESSKLVGAKVQTPDGKDVGSIDQVIINDKDGKITHAVVSKGGVLGIGATKLALKWSDVKMQRDPDSEDHWLAVIDPAKLDAAPRYEARKEGDTAPSASPAPTPAPDASKAPAKTKKNAR